MHKWPILRNVRFNQKLKIFRSLFSLFAYDMRSFDVVKSRFRRLVFLSKSYPIQNCGFSVEKRQSTSGKIDFECLNGSNIGHLRGDISWDGVDWKVVEGSIASKAFFPRDVLNCEGKTLPLARVFFYSSTVFCCLNCFPPLIKSKHVCKILIFRDCKWGISGC